MNEGKAGFHVITMEYRYVKFKLSLLDEFWGELWGDFMSYGVVFAPNMMVWCMDG